MALARSTSNISSELVGPVLFVFVVPGVPPPGDIWDPALLPKGGPKGAGGGVSDEDGGPNFAPTVPMFFSILKKKGTPIYKQTHFCILHQRLCRILIKSI